MPDMDPEEDLLVALAAATAGATELMQWYRTAGVRDAAESKGERRNLVTGADRASEEAILACLNSARPGDTVVAEESVLEEATRGRVWFVDPLDGTNNFTQGIPLFCVSIGLLVDGEPRVGVVHAPMLGEVHAAVLGDSPRATLNGEPVSVSPTDELADSIVATGFAYDREEIEDDNVDNFTRVLMRVRGMRRGGSAALDLAWVAAGRLDAFWELWLNPWDVAAGAALVRAAGGVVTDMTGGTDWLTGRHVAVSNGRVHAELLGTLARPGFAGS